MDSVQAFMTGFVDGQRSEHRKVFGAGVKFRPTRESKALDGLRRGGAARERALRELAPQARER